MTITEIKKIGSGKRYYLIIDEFNKYKIEADVLARFKLKTGQEIDEELLQKLLYDNDDFSAFDRALTYLEKNIKTKKGIVDYLKQKGYMPQAIEKAINKLEEYGYINDEVFAENYIRTYASKKGAKLLKMELISKGVDRQIAEDKIEELIDDDMQKESCQLLLKKYIKGKDLNDIKLKNKCFAYLMSKGFKSGEISEVIREVLTCELE